ncbi:tat pathway signal sequence [Colletotrichum karsti]|uniref:Tat pathway signal sequence n=1 Tax=Colletotrichum karsti TaxID=1095194 RepID=A0A9P6IEU7_9PEZI|nr:tat pathway signal sequence [Colletotrichum karsti]KAF9881435.1 tat pathway signal sequence [Colletotrichum karsti]
MEGGVKPEPSDTNHLLATPLATLQNQNARGSHESPYVTAPSSATTLRADTETPRQIKLEGGALSEMKQELPAGNVDHDIPTGEPESGIPEINQHQEPDPLEQWAKETSPEVLEEGVKIGLDLLENLKFPLNAAAAASLSDTQAPAWLNAIKDLQSRSKASKTIVGVVGNTGAGKSSVINALLDEERLLPTNCLRACTASPTEISYNYSDDAFELYRAEIEFISADDWIKELKTLYTDLFDDNGNVSRECTNPDTEAGIAYAKIKSVYPSKTNNMIADSSPERLANEPAVRGVLGSVKKLRSTTAKELYNGMQRYVDSKEKNNHLKKDVSMEYWPLIKVVRIYTKANALSTGAVIVDLPGVQDSNAARAAVAQQYMKACTGLWIVAPINRAVDDKTAKSLLGDSFKRQLKYDGIYSAVTFICSKTDDISVIEAAESLDIESDVSESWTKIDDLRRQIGALKKELASGRDEKAELIDKLEQLDSTWETWDELSQKFSDGKTVYAPSENSKKRKRGATSKKSRKNHMSSDSDDSDSDSDFESASDKENQPEDEGRVPLTDDQIQEKLAELKAQRKEVRQLRKEVDASLSDIRQQMKPLQAEESRLLGAVKAVCIQGRNGYSKGAIQRDFAMGIKELDQEAAIEEDENTFNPDEDIRDYDEVARNLPVFCVSSRAYQKMRGRLQKDDFNNDGFRDVSETEIPQLQQHAKKLTEGGRAATCRRFLNDLSQLLNSMKMWATNDGTLSYMSDKDKKTEESQLRRRLLDLEREFAKAVDECLTSMKDALAESIYDHFDRTIPSAADAAVPTASSWGAPRSMGGMFWATYKATCRRAGVYSGASGPRDFNAELFEPISKQLATGWEKAFQRHLPRALEGFSMSARLVLENFHRAAVATSQQRGTNFAGINMLSQQLRTHITRLKEIPGLLRTTIQDLQREASRGFHPIITEDMQPAYDICVEERGSGSYARMKNHMVTHVEQNRESMFRHATDTVKVLLQQLCKRVEDDMAIQVQDIYNLLARDYLAVIVGIDSNVQPTGLPRSERLLRAEMLPILYDTAQWFAKSSATEDEGPAEEVDPFAGDDDNVDDLLTSQLNDEARASAHGSVHVKAEAAM